MNPRTDSGSQSTRSQSSSTSCGSASKRSSLMSALHLPSFGQHHHHHHHDPPADKAVPAVQHHHLFGAHRPGAKAPAPILTDHAPPDALDARPLMASPVDMHARPAGHSYPDSPPPVFSASYPSPPAYASAPPLRKKDTSASAPAPVPSPSLPLPAPSHRRSASDHRRLSNTVNYCGRHSNDWLFSGFSIRDSVRGLLRDGERDGKAPPSHDDPPRRR
ncbi:hypothetical protein LOZ64_000080 [Ophidiomyces ophidiicola]|nr:hypothetical protein LOZ64_000080 [Ophidiomyces ophidiicola]KAI2021826.1 hypothetical protein LOZ46_002247 [Ophidiomyces ophidiicola]KAI2039518.1 hypothetical protein LOZ47_002155 [Ophidiomyces ophidiicola]KAI2056697.1 hypothetical protein LOZ44_001968 [Ophidiomyces ophidiicola]KAI2139811.1 hypothetical protein LOZ28_003022 [Ophidiomyces ophidiicola]